MLQKFSLTSFGQSLIIRKIFHPLMKIGNHSIYLSLLQHNLRNMDLVAILNLSPRKVSSLFCISREYILRNRGSIFHDVQKKNYPAKIAIVIKAIIQSPVHNQNQSKNLPLIVLWRRNSIAARDPTQPPAPANVKSVFSLILHLWCCAFHLSIHQTTKVARLMRTK